MAGHKKDRNMWGLYGGALVSDDYYSDEQGHKHFYAEILGLVVTEPRFKLTDPLKRKQKAQRRYVEFVVATDPQEKWRVVCYEEEKFYRIAAAVQRYDTVKLSGEYIEADYILRTGRHRGEVRTGRYFRITFIIPAYLILDPQGYLNSFLRPADELHDKAILEDLDAEPEEPDWASIPPDKILGYDKGG